MTRNGTRNPVQSRPPEKGIVMSRNATSPMLKVRDVASQLVVSEKTVRRWIDRGDIHVHRLGRQIRISVDDLAAFSASRRR